MAQKTIVWSQSALSELRSILEFYSERNQSNNYSEWLLLQIEARVNLLAQYPEMGRVTQKKDVRIFPFLYYGIIYKLSKSQMRIESVWDFRQNPNLRIDRR